MSASPRKNRLAFRPALNDVLLEDRVVLNATPRAAWLGGGGWAGPLNRMNAAPRAAWFGGGGWAPTQAQNGFGVQQIHQNYVNQLRASQRFVTQFADGQTNALYQTPGNLGPNGQLTQEALQNYTNSLAGGLNAAAFRLGAQTSILPLSSRLAGNIQGSLIGSQRFNLATRVANLVGSGRAGNSPWMLQQTVNRAINQTFAANANALNAYFRTQPLSQYSIDPTTGQRIPLSQYMSQQAVGQINNIFGAMVNSVQGIANQTIFDANGNYVPANLPAFQQQYADALGTAGTQLAGILSLFPNGQSLAPQLQNDLFALGNNANGQPNVSLLNALINSFPQTPAPVPTTPTIQAAALEVAIPPGDPNIGQQPQQPFGPTMFWTEFQNQFTPAYQNFSSTINGFFGTQGSTALPNGFFQAGATFPNVFNPAFTGSTFNSGFNNGFLATGSGFPGYGIAPSGFPGAYGTGFSGLGGSFNQSFGFNVPTLFNPGGGIGGGII